MNRLRIGIVSPVWFPVPPTGYGGIEAIVSLLADGLVDAGHEVTLFASGDSHTKADLQAVFPQAPSERIGQTFWELQHFLLALESSRGLDVLNDHTGLLGLALGGISHAPLVHTVHGPLVGEPGEMYEQICRLVPDARLISLSMNQRRPKPDLPWLANCPNALDLSRYAFQPDGGDYLAFVGRMSPSKGAHRAAAIARDLGLPLKLVGKNREPLEQQYFRESVEPLLGDGREYLGEVTVDEKVELLRGARATLFPIDWEEPFGLVMIESMACGTPVIATRWGAVPEVVEHGRSGIIVEDGGDWAAALAEADRLDRLECRRSVEERFTPERMVRDYVAAYEEAIAGAVSPPLAG